MIDFSSNEQNYENVYSTLDNINISIDTDIKEYNNYKLQLESMNPLLRTPKMLYDYKVLLAKQLKVFGDEMDDIRLMIESLGFPSIIAEYEGEKIASALAIEGIVSAVWSEDTDNYALGTPITITGFSGVGIDKKLNVDVVILQYILEDLSTYCGWQVTHQHFVDFCIMHGTDFNQKIYGMGEVAILKIFKSYYHIDNCVNLTQSTDSNVLTNLNILKDIRMLKDINILNHHRVREIFRYEPSGYNKTSKEVCFDEQLYKTNLQNVTMKCKVDQALSMNLHNCVYNTYCININTNNNTNNNVNTNINTNINANNVTSQIPSLSSVIENMKNLNIKQ